MLFTRHQSSKAHLRWPCCKSPQRQIYPQGNQHQQQHQARTTPANHPGDSPNQLTWHWFSVHARCTLSSVKGRNSSNSRASSLSTKSAASSKTPKLSKSPISVVPKISLLVSTKLFISSNNVASPLPLSTPITNSIRLRMTYLSPPKYAVLDNTSLALNVPSVPSKTVPNVSGSHFCFAKSPS